MDIVSVDNLLAAWQEFVRGKRGKRDVQVFSLCLMDNIISLHDDLATGRHRHGAYEHFRIADPKPRDIHKASVRDRVLHHAIYRQLYPFFDRTFIADSFSCRLNKGTHRALNHFRAMAYQVSRNHTSTCWVLKCDIRKFFASIDHAVLLQILKEYVPDERIRTLLDEIVGSFESMPGKGLPLGNLTSQLFCNVYMNVFDQFVKHRLKAKHYIRYADDFVILSYDRALLVQLTPRIADFLRTNLNLLLHPKKVSIKTLASGVDFLGWVHFSDHRVLRTATKRRMVRNIKEHSKPEVIASYAGLLSHGNTRRLRHLL